MKTCPECGVEFLPTHWRQRFCCRAHQQRFNIRRYMATEAGRASVERHRKSAKGKAARERYRKSAEGKAVRERWLSSENGRASVERTESKDATKAARKRYRRSEKYKLAQRRFFSSPKGRELRRATDLRYYARRQQTLQSLIITQLESYLMNATVKSKPAAPEMLTDDDLGRMSLPQLLEHLKEIHNHTAKWVMYATRVWSAAQQKAREAGDDLSHLKLGAIGYYGRVAEGSVLPETVATLQGRPKLLARVAALTVARQRELVCEGKGVPVVTRLADGKADYREMPLTAILMKPRLADQVFGDGMVRSVQEQVALLTTEPTPAARKSIKVGRATYDRGQDSVRIGRELAPAQEVIDALKKAGRIPM